ncbi:ornithine cyclodeaminase family protein [Paenibacillus tepidiphilus]|uniref:ornithine cyclodeaminase family protein n=1 Tax=Paenibacillus tepidiphilus TaxID=2608683 RepID=UPI0013A52D50|nr:ornithine cyclodeaminase family protein [Paenibacillus tepidiphilus]
MLVINRTEAAELLTMEACIEIMAEVLADLSAGRALQSLRQVMPLEAGNLLGLMPGYLKQEAVAGAKLISVFPHNHALGLPSHQGAVALFDAAGGVLRALVDGRAITAIRTAAASAAATRVLAREDAAELAIIGTGEQAASHLEAMLKVRNIRRVRVWSRSKGKAQQFAAEQAARWSTEVTAAGTVREAVHHADIICTVTAAAEPVLRGEWVRPGTHINAVGACRPHERELDSALVASSRLFVDRRESAVNEAGDYLIPLQEGVIGAEHIAGEIGEWFERRVSGRTGEQEITLFKSLGLAVQDLAAANYIYKRALALHRGTEIPW